MLLSWCTCPTYANHFLWSCHSAHTWVILVCPILSYIPLLLAFMWILCILCVNPVLSRGLGVFAHLCVTCPWVQCLIILEFSILPIFRWWFTSGGHHEFKIWLFVSSVSCCSCVGQQWFTLNLCGHLDFNILFLKCGILPFTDCDSLSPKSNILLFLSSASCCSLVRTTNLFAFCVWIRFSLVALGYLHACVLPVHEFNVLLFSSSASCRYFVGDSLPVVMCQASSW